MLHVRKTKGTDVNEKRLMFFFYILSYFFSHTSELPLILSYPTKLFLWFEIGSIKVVFQAWGSEQCTVLKIEFVENTQGDGRREGKLYLICIPIATKNYPSFRSLVDEFKILKRLTNKRLTETKFILQLIKNTVNFKSCYI